MPRKAKEVMICRESDNLYSVRAYYLGFGELVETDLSLEEASFIKKTKPHWNSSLGTWQGSYGPHKNTTIKSLCDMYFHG